MAYFVAFRLFSGFIVFALLSSFMCFWEEASTLPSYSTIFFQKICAECILFHNNTELDNFFWRSYADYLTAIATIIFSGHVHMQQVTVPVRGCILLRLPLNKRISDVTMKMNFTEKEWGQISYRLGVPCVYYCSVFHFPKLSYFIWSSLLPCEAGKVRAMAQMRSQA